MPAESLDAIDPRDLGARLREARNARGWTQKQAAESLGVARTTMVAIEKGDRQIKPDELVELARLYGRKLSSILRAGEPLEDFSVQLRGSLSPDMPIDTELLPHIYELERLCDDYVELERLCGVPLSRHDPPEYALEGMAPELVAEDVAQRERNRLGLGDAAVLNLRTILEGDLGLRVFYLGLPSAVAGMFAYTEEHGGTVGVNRKHPPERRRHTMAHEYGHFLTDRYRSEITFLDRYERRPASERFAETFGRAFLMPAATVRRRFHELVLESNQKEGGHPTPGHVCRLAHFFFVSMEAMTRRLEELDLIRTGSWERLQQHGFRVREAQRLLGLQERAVDDGIVPPRYRVLAVEAWQRGDLSEGQLASFLRVDRLTARRLVRETGLDHDADGQLALDLTASIEAVG